MAAALAAGPVFPAACVKRPPPKPPPQPFARAQEENTAISEALRIFREEGDRLKAAKEPDRFLFTFEHLFEKFPPLAELKKLPGPRRKEMADLLNGLGIAMQHKDRIEEAEERFNEAIALWPGERAFYFNLGILQVQTGNFDASEKLFKGLLDEGNLTGEQEELCRGWLMQIEKLKAQREAAKQR